MDYLLNYVDNDKLETSLENVLNLIINGLPSKRYMRYIKGKTEKVCFKPYYKWITF